MNHKKNLPEDEKQKLLEYRKKYYKMRKTPYYNSKKLFSFRKFVFLLEVELIRWARWVSLSGIRNFHFKVNLFQKFASYKKATAIPKNIRNFWILKIVFFENIFFDNAVLKGANLKIPFL